MSKSSEEFSYSTTHCLCTTNLLLSPISSLFLMSSFVIYNSHSIPSNGFQMDIKWITKKNFWAFFASDLQIIYHRPRAYDEASLFHYGFWNLYVETNFSSGFFLHQPHLEPNGNLHLYQGPRRFSPNFMIPKLVFI